MKDTGNYWQTDESLVHGTSIHNAGEIHFSVITEASQHTVALQTNSVDISNGVPDTDISKFEEDGEFSEGNAVSIVKDNLTYDVEYNMSDKSVFKDDEIFVSHLHMPLIKTESIWGYSMETVLL